MVSADKFNLIARIPERFEKRLDICFRFSLIGHLFCERVNPFRDFKRLENPLRRLLGEIIRTDEGMRFVNSVAVVISDGVKSHT